MPYLLRVNDNGTWTQSIVAVDVEMSSFVAPIYRWNANVRVYLFELLLTKAAPNVLAVWRGVDAVDPNNIVFFVESLSGRSLFSFNFPKVEE